MDNSLDDIFMPQTMSSISGLARQLMAAGAHGHVLCSGMQFPRWYEKVDSMQEEGPNFEADSRVEVSIRRVIFEIEFILFHSRRTPGNDLIDLCIRKLTRTSVIEISWHFWRIYLQWTKMPFMVDYNAINLVASSLPLWKNEMNNAPFFGAEEESCRNPLSDSGYKKMLLT